MFYHLVSGNETASPRCCLDRVLGPRVAATSLDWLAGELGVTKQTILYHYGSKHGLVREVFASAADELLVVMAAAVERSEPGDERIEATVRAAFALAVRRPELIGLLREAGRLGPPTSAVVLERLQPFVDSAIAYLDDGSPQRHPRRPIGASFCIHHGHRCC